MIDLTPLEVRKKKGDFKRTLRGYDASLVDDFLDLVADRLEQVVRAKLALEEQVRSLEQRVTAFTDREKGLTDALVSAQEMREDTRQQMSREADLSRREAEAEAEQIRQSAHRDREREEDTLRRLRARQRQLVASYRTFLERELSELDVIHETLELQGREAGRLPAPDPDREDAGDEPPPASPPEGPVDAAVDAAAGRTKALRDEGRAAERSRFRYVHAPELPLEDSGGDAGAGDGQEQDGGDAGAGDGQEQVAGEADGQKEDREGGAPGEPPPGPLPR